MNHERWHVIEKIQVQVAAVAAWCFMYFVGWRLISPTDVDGALVFLPVGAVGDLVLFALVVWFMAAGCALLTISARMEGPVLALLVGVSAASMRTAPMRLLVSRFEDDLSSLMLPLVADMASLVLVLVGATIVIGLVRRVLRPLCPGWVWPARRFSDEADAPDTSDGEPAAGGVLRSLGWLLLTGRLRADRQAERGVGAHAQRGEAALSASDMAVSIVASFGVTLLIGLLGMIVTFIGTGSIERGQIIFALAVSFFLASLAASYFFPTGFSAPCWLAPVVLAMVIYLKNCWVAPQAPLTWAMVGPMANILPVDWLCAGCGGAVGGYWLSSRLHELKHLTKDEAE